MFFPTHSPWLYNHVSMCTSGARVRSWPCSFSQASGLLREFHWHLQVERLTKEDFVLTACINLHRKQNSTAASIIADVALHIVDNFIRLLYSWWSTAHHRAVNQLKEPNWMRSQWGTEGTSNHLITFHNCSLWASLQMDVYDTSPGFIKTLSAESGLEFGLEWIAPPFLLLCS